MDESRFDFSLDLRIAKNEQIFERTPFKPRAEQVGVGGIADPPAHDGHPAPLAEQVAEILGIPSDTYTQGGLFPIAYTKGTDFKPAKRTPAEQLIHWDAW